MDAKWDLPVDIPDDLEEVIRQGVLQGRQLAARRRKVRQFAVRTVCSFVVAVGLFAGGIHVSPAFAAAVDDVPILGRLVQVFGINQPVVQGGSSQSQAERVLLTTERTGDTEQMRLTFPLADAAAYRAEFASYPKTVTITLPGTGTVEILSQISRAKDTSQYIKSVCRLPTNVQGTAVIQLCLESDANVQIQEYRDPGSLVIELYPADIQLDTIYSVRTLSMPAEEVAAAADRLDGHPARMLQDGGGTFFLELGQFSTREEAQAYAGHPPVDGLIVESRTGNNVPVAFSSLQDYESALLLDSYYELLITSDTVEPVLDFLDAHFSQASPQEQDTMLRGLTGFLEGGEEETNWNRIAAYYQQAGQAIPASISPSISP